MRKICLSLLVVLCALGMLVSVGHAGKNGKGIACATGHQITINCGTTQNPVPKSVVCRDRNPDVKQWASDDPGSPSYRKAEWECGKHDGCDSIQTSDDGKCGGFAAVGDSASE